MRHHDTRWQFGQRINQGHGRPGSHSDGIKPGKSPGNEIGLALRQIRQ